MTNSKNTKRALLSSLLALILCFAMLLGTTFAWFTDTASAGVSTVQAGTLDIVLQMEDGTNEDGTTKWVSAEGQTLEFVKADGAADGEKILWEPGCTYSLPKLRVVNNGDLALKYKVMITGITGDTGLNKVIDWTVNGVELGKEQSLAAGMNQEFTVSGRMQETAGNEYQGLKIENISLTVYATQDTVESDSNNNQYDKNAVYPNYINKSDKKNGTVYKGKQVTLNAYEVEHEYDGAVSDGTAFYLYNGAELTVSDMEFSTSVKNDTGNRHIGFYLYNGAKLTINSGNYTMDGQYSALIWAQGGTNGERCTVTINGGTFTVKGGGNSTIVNAYSGSGYCGSDVSITGGFFDLSAANPNVTLQWKNDCTMTVTGGTFVNYNPADHGVVPAGYKVTSAAQSNGTTWYTVVHE